MPDPGRFREFIAVVDAGSISAAARALGLPRATLSRRLSSLESELGVRLLSRQTRSLKLTHAGELLEGRARRLVEEMDEAWEVVRQVDETPRGRLRLSVPPSDLFRELLLDFVIAHPLVHVQVIATPAHLDLFAEGIDVALRFGRVMDEALIARRLWSDRASVVAAPSFLEREGSLDRLRDLSERGCITGFTAGHRPRASWPLCAGGDVPIRSVFASNELPLRMRAVLQGVGLALVPARVSSHHLESGALEAVLEGIVGAEVSVSLVYPERAFLPPQVRAFIEHTSQYFETHPMSSGDLSHHF